MSVSYLGLLKVEVLADGGQQPTQALQGLGVVVLEQLHDAVVHDDLGEHLELEELPDELDVAQRAPPGLVFGALQLVGELLLLLWLPEENKRSGWRPATCFVWSPVNTHCSYFTTEAASSSFCILSKISSSSLSFSNSFWHLFSSSLRKFTKVPGLSEVSTLS